MSDQKILDIIAYYLSEFDSKAFSFLGYENQSKGFDGLSAIFGCKSSYIRRLRDEYDVVTNSKRKGQRNRPPRKRILDTKERFQSVSFEELSEMISAFIENALSNSADSPVDVPITSEVDACKLSEQNIEQILNFSDPDAHIKISSSQHKVRIYSTSIIRQLKKLYGGKCQLCGFGIEVQGKPVDITEAHNIDYFSSSENNNSRNLLIVCPNHHALIHKLNPSFDRETLCYVFEGGHEIPVILNYHL